MATRRRRCAGESEDRCAGRDALLEDERAPRRAVEPVAQLRRALPQGPMRPALPGALDDDARHLRRRIPLAVVAAPPAEEPARFGRSRGRRHLRPPPGRGDRCPGPAPDTAPLRGPA